jgi:zinc protease
MKRRIALFAALLLVASACTGPSADTTSTTAPAPTTPSTSPRTTTTTIPRSPEMPTWPDDDEPLPTDGDVIIGALDNGLTYYIRENRAPGGRAQLRLAVQAGSVQEDPSQHGAAHYLEHMAFNGTERFPANELVKVLQRFGAEFGADINAYTAYDETVYKLELPTDNPTTVAAGFDVLYEWAVAITLDPDEVELERGVVVEEWRLRDQGFWGRYFAGVSEVLLAGSEYEGRDPLGELEDIEGITVEGLRDFYETWYRTDTMAIVAVGDFRAEDIEALIVERFDGVEASADPTPVPVPSTEAATEATFMVLADPETVEAFAELNYPLPAADSRTRDRHPANVAPATVGAARRALAMEMAWTILVNRLDEASLRGEVPFWNAGFAANPLVRGQQSPGLAAYSQPEDLAETTAALLTAVEQAMIHGFTDGEFGRAITEVRATVQLDFDERATTQDRDYADEYAEHFLGTGAIPEAEDWYDLRQRLLDEMTVDDVWNVWGSTVQSTEPLVIIAAPDGDSGGIPDEGDLAEIIARVETATHEPWVDDSIEIDTLMNRPEPAAISARDQFSDTNLTEITLANGARVIFFESNIREDVVVFGAASAGGWALLDPTDVAEAQMVGGIVTRSGVGDYDQVTLDRFLSGVNVSLTPYIDEAEEGFFGEAATRDLETLLQLVHLYMTAPRFEEVALGLAVSETLPFAEDPGQVPDLAVSLAAAEELYAGDPRFASIPPADDLRTLDLGVAGEVFRNRFDDPGDFVFVFAGDFEEAIAEDLARAYLGTIPGPGDTDMWVDVRPDPPSRVIDRTVEAGTGELGGITFVFATEIALDRDTRIQIDLLELVLQQKLTDRIREELSASYSPFTYVQLTEAPVEGVELWIQVSADPADLDAITAEVLGVLETLRDNGPTADEMAIAQEQLAREIELISNEQLSRAIIFSALHPDEGLYANVIEPIAEGLPYTFGRTDIRGLARELLPEDRYVEIRLVPID